MGLIAAWDRLIARSAHEGAKRQVAEAHRLRERDAERYQERLAAGLEQPIDWGLHVPSASDSYNLEAGNEKENN